MRWIPLVYACAVLGCGGLGEERARELLEERFEQINPRSCVWTHAKGDHYIDLDYRGVRECVQELEKAGVAKRGGCRDGEPGGSVCFERTLVTLEHGSRSEDGLVFRCGELELLAIKYIESRSANEAIVSYEREFEAPLLRKVQHCTYMLLRHPVEGRAGTDVMFTRDADGVWHIGDHVPDDHL